MRALIITLVIAFCVARGFAQSDFSLSVGTEYSENFNFRNYSGLIQVEVPVGDKLSLNYKLLLGASSKRAFYLHAPIGAASGVFLLNNLGGSNTKVINTLGVLLIILPEGITFYPNPSDDIRVGIYASPLGCDYWHKKSDYEYFRLSGETGGKVKIALGKDEQFDLIVHAGVKYLYRNADVEPFFVNGGLSFSYNF